MVKIPPFCSRELKASTEQEPGVLCGGKVEWRSTRGRFYPYRLGVTYEIPTDIPTLTCVDCGETYLTDAEFEAIEQRFLNTSPRDLTACPYCKTDLVGTEIPVKFRQHFGGASHGGRVVTLYDPQLEGNVGHQCPDCGAMLGEWGLPIQAPRV